MIQRREFFTLLGGAAAVWPLAARAQQGDRVRRIGVLMPGDENDPLVKVSAFTQALADLGWTDGRNVRLDVLTPIGYELSRKSWWSRNPKSSLQTAPQRLLPCSGRRRRPRSFL